MYKYKVRVNGEWVIGVQEKTKGNDEEYPTFILEDGRRVGVRREDVGDVVPET